MDWVSERGRDIDRRAGERKTEASYMSNGKIIFDCWKQVKKEKNIRKRVREMYVWVWKPKS